MMEIDEESSRDSLLSLLDDSASEDNDSTTKSGHWQSLVYAGPAFYPKYEPSKVPLKYTRDDNTEIEIILNPKAEEYATFYARAMNRDCVNSTFIKNFKVDWDAVMTVQERETIKNFNKCDFTAIEKYIKKKDKEDDEENKKQKLINGVCIVDGVPETIDYFRVERPGLFCGKEQNDNLGKVKEPVRPSDVTVNRTENYKNHVPPEEDWKSTSPDNTVAWLAKWKDKLTNKYKYIWRSAASKDRMEITEEKFELARELGNQINRIRSLYEKDWESDNDFLRQAGVATYFLDTLAFRVGTEKNEDKDATVGCTSLKCMHVEYKLGQSSDGNSQIYYLDFDFHAKGHVPFRKRVSVPEKVYTNITAFKRNKSSEKFLFDNLNAVNLNKYLEDKMPNLTSKVFKTYTASSMMETELKKFNNPNASLAEKLSHYKISYRKVVILCNHRRTEPKKWKGSMNVVEEKIEKKKREITEKEKGLREAEEKGCPSVEDIRLKIKKLLDQLEILSVRKASVEKEKDLSMSTAKNNYIDPRIIVAWCAKWKFPISEIYTKRERAIFQWAIVRNEENFVF